MIDSRIIEATPSEGYEEFARHRNEAVFFERTSAARLEASDQSFNANRKRGRYLIPGVAAGAYIHSPREDGASVWWIQVSTESADAHSEMTAHLLRVVRSLSDEPILSAAHTGQPHGIKSLEVFGFEEVQRNPVSVLDVRAWQPREIAPPHGIRCLSLPELAVESPSDWDLRYWQFTMESLRDVPMPIPAPEVPFDEFMSGLYGISTDLSMHLVALDGDAIVAGTAIDVWDNLDAGTHLTAVARSHRRQGLARWLKTEALTRAQAAGVNRIYTDNEADNPMLTLNVELGFRPCCDLVLLRLNPTRSTE